MLPADPFLPLCSAAQSRHLFFSSHMLSVPDQWGKREVLGLGGWGEWRKVRHNGLQNMFPLYSLTLLGNQLFGSSISQLVSKINIHSYDPPVTNHSFFKLLSQSLIYSFAQSLNQSFKQFLRQAISLSVVNTISKSDIHLLCHSFTQRSSISHSWEFFLHSSIQWTSKWLHGREELGK